MRRCPWAHYDARTWEAIEWWSDWKRFGALPYQGDILDQPAYVYEAICAADGAAQDLATERVDDGRGKNSPNR